MNMTKTKCITFDKAAQDALPEHIKDKMKADREAVDHARRENELSLMHIIRSGSKTYFVKFSDNEKELLVHADNFIKAGILAMAYIVLLQGVGFDIEYVRDLNGMKVKVDIK